MTETQKVELERLARTNRELERFASIAAHDLQEPLRLVAGYLDLLVAHHEGRATLDPGALAREARDAAARMQRMVTDLLEYSRLPAQSLRVGPVPLGLPLQAALANLGRAISESRANITHDTLPVVEADAAQLARVLQNLIGNAVKFTRPGEPPRVHLSARRDASGWTISVRDNGVGLPAQGAELLFQPLRRLHGDEYPGTGLGLALCRQVVEAHGGRIWAQRHPDGTEFLFTLRSGSA